MLLSETTPQNLTDLQFSEQLTLWSIRYWAHSCQRKQSPYGVLKDAYRLAKCPDCLLSMDSFMTLMVSGNCRPVDIRCLCCPGISADEWRILQSLAFLQKGDKQFAPRLVSHFLEPSATRLTLPILVEWAQHLMAGNHVLPAREEVLAAAQRTHAAAPSQHETPVRSSQETALIH